MVDSGISSSGFGQAGVGTDVAGKGHLGHNQALEFEVVEAGLGTLAEEIGVTLQGTLEMSGFLGCLMFSFFSGQFRNSLPIFFMENVYI